MVAMCLPLSLDGVFGIPPLLNPEQVIGFFFLKRSRDEWLPSFLHSQVPFSVNVF